MYKAADTKEKRDVALKVIIDPTRSQERREQEVTIHSQLHHPHIVMFHRAGEVTSTSYLDIELAEEDLASRLRQAGKLPINEVVTLIDEASSALSYAHQEGIIHRDIKPHSLFYTKQGNIKVGDWGSALPIPTRTSWYIDDELLNGTPEYCAPEQFSGKPSIQSDVYTLGGLVAYEAITNRRVMRGIRDHIIPPPSFERILKGDMTDVYAAVEVPIRKALARKPSHRQTSMEEYRSELVAAYQKAQEQKEKEHTTIDLGVTRQRILWKRR